MSQLEAAQYDALAAVQARIAGQAATDDGNKSIGTFLTCLGYLEAVAHTAISVASTQDQEAVARELAGTVEGWRGVRDVVEEGLGSHVIELVDDLARGQLAILEALVSHVLSTDSTTTEELDNLWDLREGLEFLLAYMAGLAAKESAAVHVALG